VEQTERDEGAEHGPRVVERAQPAKRNTPALGGHRVSQQRITRRAAHPLAEPVAEAQRQHVRPGRGQAERGAQRVRQQVAGAGEGLATPEPVRSHAARESCQARGGLGQAFDQAEEDGRGPEHRRHERGQQRVDHLRADVVTERRRPHREGVPALVALPLARSGRSHAS